MNKILIIFSLIALATFAGARKHQYNDNYYRSSSSSNNESNRSSNGGSNYGSNSYSSPSYGSNSYGSNSYGSSSSYGSSPYGGSGGSSSYDSYGSRGGRRPSTLEQVNSVRSNATLLQENIDLYSGFVSIILSASEHQDTIRNYTRRIRNIVALIDVSAVRNLVTGVTNEAFDSLRSLRNTLHSELVKLNASSDPTLELNLILDSMKFAAEEEFQHLKGYLIDSLINITQVHRERLSQADQETIADVRMLVEQLFGSVHRSYMVSRRGLEDLRRVINLQRARDNTAERIRMEGEIRTQVLRLIQELEGLNIDRLEAITNSAVNLAFDRLHQLQQRVADVSKRALESHQPGSVLAEELIQLREGLGQSLVDFQKNLESGLIRLVRDLLRSSRVRGIYGNSVEVIAESIANRVEERVDSIIDLFDRNQNLLRRSNQPY